VRIELVFVGKTRFPEADEGIHRYLTRLRRYLPDRVHTVRAEKITRSVTQEMVRERESRRIRQLIGKNDRLVLWDERGKGMSSEELAAFLKDAQLKGESKLWMVVGGPLGLSGKFRQEAHTVLALSRMTFPHDLARLLVVEQLYRAFTILRGEPYHK